MKFPLLDAYPCEGKIEAHRGAAYTDRGDETGTKAPDDKKDRWKQIYNSPGAVRRKMYVGEKVVFLMCADYGEYPLMG